MRAASARILTCLTLLATTTACGRELVARPEVTPAPSARITEEQREIDLETADPGSSEEELTLPDGRRVAMQYKSGRGLFEQHYNPDTGSGHTPA